MNVPPFVPDHRGPSSDRIERDLGASALRLCSITETCALLGVSRWQVYQLINRRELNTVKIGRRRLVPLVDLQAFINRQRQAEVLI